MNTTLFSYPIWDPSDAMKQLAYNNELSDKSICSNFAPAVIYFLADALKNGSKPFQLNRIEQIDYPRIRIYKYLRKNFEKKCELLLCLPHPEVPAVDNFGEEGFLYLTTKYNFKTLKIG